MQSLSKRTNLQQTSSGSLPPGLMMPPGSRCRLRGGADIIEVLGATVQASACARHHRGKAVLAVIGGIGGQALSKYKCGAACEQSSGPS